MSADPLLSITESNIKYLRQERKEIERQKRLIDAKLQQQLPVSTNLGLISTAESIFLNQNDNISRLLQDKESRKARNSTILDSLKSPLPLSSSDDLEHKKLHFLTTFNRQIPFYRSLKEQKELELIEKQVRSMEMKLSMEKKGWKNEVEHVEKKRVMNLKLLELQQRLEAEKMIQSAERMKRKKRADRETKRLLRQLTETKVVQKNDLQAYLQTSTSEESEEEERTLNLQEINVSPSMRTRPIRDLKLTRRPPPSQRIVPSATRKRRRNIRRKRRERIQNESPPKQIVKQEIVEEARNELIEEEEEEEGEIFEESDIIDEQIPLSDHHQEEEEEEKEGEIFTKSEPSVEVSRQFEDEESLESEEEIEPEPSIELSPDPEQEQKHEIPTPLETTLDLPEETPEKLKIEQSQEEEENIDSSDLERYYDTSLRISERDRVRMSSESEILRPRFSSESPIESPISKNEEKPSLMLVTEEEEDVAESVEEIKDETETENEKIEKVIPVIEEEPELPPPHPIQAPKPSFEPEPKKIKIVEKKKSPPKPKKKKVELPVLKKKKKQEVEIDMKEEFLKILNSQSYPKFYLTLRILIKHIEHLLTPTRKFLNMSWHVRKKKLVKDLYTTYSTSPMREDTKKRRKRKKKKAKTKNQIMRLLNPKYEPFVHILQKLFEDQEDKPNEDVLHLSRREDDKDDQKNRSDEIKVVSDLVVQMMSSSPHEILCDGFVNKLIQFGDQAPKLVQVKKVIFHPIQRKLWRFLTFHLKKLRKEVSVSRQKIENVISNFSSAMFKEEIDTEEEQTTESNNKNVKSLLLIYFKYHIKIEDPEEEEGESGDDDDDELDSEKVLSEYSERETNNQNPKSKNRRRESFASTASETFTFDSALSSSEFMGLDTISSGFSIPRKRRSSDGIKKKKKKPSTPLPMDEKEEKEDQDFINTILEGVNLDDSLLDDDVGTTTETDDDNPFSF